MITRLKQLDWSDWIYSLLKAFIGGGASAIAVTFTASVIKPDAFNLGTQLHSFLELVFTAFTINGTLHLCYLLSQSPLPAKIETTTTTKIQTDIKSVEKQ